MTRPKNWKSMTCEVSGCTSPVYQRKMCGAHYGRWFRNGDPVPYLRAPSGSGYIQHGYKIVRGKREHRAVMEKHLGRKLKREEHVHHIDGNKLNNEISNLQVVSAFQHLKIHRPGIKVYVKCRNCGLPLAVYPSQNKRKFCDLKCYANFRRKK